ncbi:MAG TPA: hypothetical protein PL123_12630 [Bacteroidales bacterium]|nr:hypothetical protein [Bacteroidales bacterium]
MKSTVYKLFVFILMVGLTGCEKKPIEMVTGRWQLTSIEGSDTTRGNNNKILRIINLSYNNDPLIITYDSITSQSSATYNLSLQLEFKDDGTLIITEDYYTLDHTLIFSAGRTSSWHNDPSSIKPSFYLWPYESYNFFLPNQSLIFLHGNNPLLFIDDDITKRRLILHNFFDDDKITYTFKKL